MKTILSLIATALTAATLSVSVAATETHAGTGARSAAQSAKRYVPYVTDLPQSGSNVAPVDVRAGTGGRFDRLDAAIGAAAGLTLAALMAAALRPRHRRVASRRHRPETGSGRSRRISW